jgi:hypothetical protein
MGRKKSIRKINSTDHHFFALQQDKYLFGNLAVLALTPCILSLCLLSLLWLAGWLGAKY